VLQRAIHWTRTVKRDALAVWIAARDPRVPWYAKVVAALGMGYEYIERGEVPEGVSRNSLIRVRQADDLEVHMSRPEAR
jgi:hypothetical protein